MAASQATANLAEMVRLQSTLPHATSSPSVAPRHPHRPRGRLARSPLSAQASPAVEPPLADGLQGGRVSTDRSASPSLRSGESSPAIGPAPARSFRAIDDDGAWIPPDTDGAVGPDRIMTMLNSDLLIQDKLGNPVSASGEPLPTRCFWSALYPREPPCPAHFFTDPRVRYDPYGKRWIAVELADPFGANAAILVAVSASPDPLAQWHFYMVNWPLASSHPDYPSLGFNGKWIVVSVNIFGIVSGAQDYAFDKASLYAGGAGRYTTFYDPDAWSQAPANTYDPLQQTMYLVETWDGTASAQLRMVTISGSVGAEVYTSLCPSTATTCANASLPVTPWSGGSGDAVRGGFAPQLGSPMLIDTDDDRMQSLVYRNGSLWTAQTVFLPAGRPTHSAVQWAQLMPSSAPAVGASTVQAGRVDTPAGATDPAGTAMGEFRAYPSIAVNSRNDVLIGYSRFSPSSFAGAAYSFHGHHDPRGSMRAETSLKDGTAPYYRSGAVVLDLRNRWGDFSAAATDPVDDLSMWTVQEYAQAMADGSPLCPSVDVCPLMAAGRWGTWWGEVVPPAAGGEASAVMLSGLAADGDGDVPMSSGGLGLCDTGPASASSTGGGLCGLGVGTLTETIPAAGSVPALTVTVTGPQETVSVPTSGTNLVTAHSAAADVAISSGGSTLLEAREIDAVAQSACQGGTGSGKSSLSWLVVAGQRVATQPVGSQIVLNPLGRWPGSPGYVRLYGNPIAVNPAGGRVPLAIVTLNYSRHDPLTGTEQVSPLAVTFPASGPLASVIRGTILVGLAQTWCS